MPVEAVCTNCSTEFEVPPSRAKKAKNLYCTHDCYKEHIGSIVELVCDTCGDTFTTNASQRPHENKYCSRQCSGKAKSHGSVVVTCETCGTQVTKQVSDTRLSDTHFCDRDCYQEHHGNRVTFNCDSCGADFTRRGSYPDDLDHHFCDRDCYNDYISIPENHPAWGGGYGRQKNWRNQRKKAVDRDGYRCQYCGVTEKEHIRSYGFGLDAHHIIPRSRFEDLSKADDIGNLVTLCRSCHNRWEGIPLRPYFYE